MESKETNSLTVKPEKQIEEKKKLNKVVSGPVKTKKKSKIAQFFQSEDMQRIKSYIAGDIIVPLIKKGITDTLDIVLYGDTNRKKRSAANVVSYNRYYDDRRYDEPRLRDRDRDRYDGGRRSIAYNFDDVTFESRIEADRVLSAMNDVIESYKMVSVADMYDLSGLSGNWTDNNYGWFNLSTADIRRTRDGWYVLDLPKAVPLK